MNLKTIKSQYQALPDPKPSWEEVEKLIPKKALKALEKPKLLWIKDDSLVICDGAKEARVKQHGVNYFEAAEWCAKNGLELMNEEEYRHLQSLRRYDVKSWSWLHTPDSALRNGLALAGDRNGERVYVDQDAARAHNPDGAFRAVLRVSLETLDNCSLLNQNLGHIYGNPVEVDFEPLTPPEKSKEAKLLEIMEFLYLEDRAYGSGQAWRKALVEKLKSIL